MKTTERLEIKNFNRPDDVRIFNKGKVEIVNIGGAVLGRAIFEPGWRWSECVKDIARTQSCEAPHFQYHVAGTIRILMDDGTEKDVGPGEVSLVPSGHDAWVVGNETVIVVDFQGMTNYAASPRPS